MAIERLPENPSAPETAPRYKLRTIEDLDREGNIAGKNVFFRGDIDVLSENEGSDPSASIRLKSFADSIRRVLDLGANKVVGAGHVGDPTGQDEKFSAKPIAKYLQVMLGEEVTFIPYEDTLNAEKVKGARSRVVLIENLRYFEGEKSQEEAKYMPFAQQLAALADVYISEAFAVSHRDHTSVSKLARLLPYAAGPHFADEIRELSALLDTPKKPFVAIVGGAKVTTKLPVIETLAKKADLVLVGGKLVKEIKKQVQDGNPLVLPENVFVADLTEDGYDISYGSAQRFAAEISHAKTLVWNGPVGFVEEHHDFGTVMIAQAILNNHGLRSVLGGGDTVDYLQGRPPGISGYSFVSSGGGAMLEFLSGNKLPGVVVLQ